MLEAALFQLRAALDAAADDDTAQQMRLGASVLAGAIASAHDGINAARVNDIDFALSDLVAMAEGLSAAVAESVAPPLQMLRDDVDRLRAATALAPEIVNAIRAFQMKLKSRRAAIERSTFREAGAPAEELPHSPATLRAEALPLRASLAAAGFATPSLDAFIDDPESLRFHSLGEIYDELEVML